MRPLTGRIDLVIINFMKRPVFYLVLTVLVIIITGCAEQQKDPDSALLQGVKISDLQPSFVPQLQPKILFRMYTFDIPAENISFVEDMFKILQTSSMRFVNYDAFRANGFAAGFGQIVIWDELGDKLRKANALGRGTNALTISSDVDDNIDVAGIGQKYTLFYVGTDGTVAGVGLAAGRIAWNIKAQPIAGQRGSAQVWIQPVFKSYKDERIAKLIGKKLSSQIDFESSGFQLVMGEGDFILMGPGQYDSQLSLDDLSLNLQGDFVDIEKPKDEQQNSFTLGDMFFKFHKKDGLVIRVYLIVFMGVRS